MPLPDHTFFLSQKILIKFDSLYLVVDLDSARGHWNSTLPSNKKQVTEWSPHSIQRQFYIHLFMLMIISVSILRVQISIYHFTKVKNRTVFLNSFSWWRTCFLLFLFVQMKCILISSWIFHLCLWHICHMHTKYKHTKKVYDRMDITQDLGLCLTNEYSI